MPFTTIRDETSVGSGKLLLGVASTVILGSVSRSTDDHILLSHDWEWFNSVRRDLNFPYNILQASYPRLFAYRAKTI
jgi:hypothetical protein